MSESILQQHLDQISSPLATSSKTFTKTLVTDWPTFNRMIEGMKKSGIWAYDTETNGTFDRFAVRMVGMSICFNDEEAFYMPLTHEEGDQLDIGEVGMALQPLFEDPQYEKIAHNAKFDEMVLSRHGIDVQGPGHCTFIMAWLLSEDTGSKGLKQLTLRHYGIEMATYEDVVSAAPKKKNVPRDYNFARVTLDSALSYAADDAYWCWQLFHKFKPQLEAEKLWGPYSNVDRPFGRVLRYVEAKGVYIDQDALNYADEHLPTVIEKVEAQIYEEAGEVFNIGSGAQLGRILFEKLGIGENVPQTATGNYSTDKNTLKLYAERNKIVANVLRRKKIKKTHSTFVQSLADAIGKDGRVHPSFNGCGTVTGRLSCSNPNLQQIEGDEVEEIKVRNFFVPAPGNTFVVADYGQIELRVMAHLAKDQVAIDAFLSGRDFHDETARAMYSLGPDEEVSHRQRFYAKSLNFGIPYGRGAVSIGEQLDILGQCKFYGHYDEELLEQGIKVWHQQGKILKKPCGDCAKCLIEKWWEAFPEIRPLKERTLAKARQLGFVRTMVGRKRRLSDINSSNRMLKARAERQAFNTLIQGSAADIIKIAMIALQEKLIAFKAHIVLQVHDELVIECPEEVAEEVRGIVQHTMAFPVNDKNPLCLPLIVDPKIVTQWGDAK